MEFKNTKYSNISIVRISIVQILKHKKCAKKMMNLKYGRKK